MKIHKISHQTNKVYETETGHFLEVIQKDDPKTCTITAYLSKTARIPPHAIGAKIYEASCDYPEGKKGMRQSLQHFLQTQLPILCENADALIHSAHTDEAEEEQALEAEARSALCKEICNKVHQELEQIADEGNLPGISRYLLDHAAKMSVLMDYKSGEAESAKWVMCDTAGILVVVDIATQSVIGSFNGKHIINLSMTENLTAALAILGEIYWDLEKHKKD